MAESLNEILTRCIKFRKDVAEQNPSALKNIENKETFLKSTVLKNIDVALTSLPPKMQIEIDLYIEKRFSEHGPLPFVCNPNWTIWTTKQEIEKQFSNLICPVDCQNVIYGHKIAKDHLTLHDCGISRPNTILYVYVYQKHQHKSPANEVFDSSMQGMDTVSMGEFVTGAQNLSITSNNSDQVPSLSESSNHLAASWYSIPQSSVSFQPESSTSGNYEMPSSVTGWECPICTYINLPTRPGCEMCSTPRPMDYEIPRNFVLSEAEKNRMEQEQKADQLTKLAISEKQQKQEVKRQRNYSSHIDATKHSIVFSSESVECLICLTTTDPGDAVTLQDCLHVFCKDCLRGHILVSSDARVKCPHGDDSYVCGSYIRDREVKALLTDEQYESYLRRSLSSAEQLSASSAHCKTPDCIGWCEYDDGVNVFVCPVCQARNCLTCQAIHHPQDCKEYQSELHRKSGKDKKAKQTHAMLERMLKLKEAIHCPQCNIIIMRKGGCDWVKCTMCKTEICWVTKGPRWGPDGHGDTSGGCHCRENGKKCHPECINCH